MPSYQKTFCYFIIVEMGIKFSKKIIFMLFIYNIMGDSGCWLFGVGGLYNVMGGSEVKNFIHIFLLV